MVHLFHLYSVKRGGERIGFERICMAGGRCAVVAAKVDFEAENPRLFVRRRNEHVCRSLLPQAASSCAKSSRRGSVYNISTGTWDPSLFIATREL